MKQNILKGAWFPAVIAVAAFTLFSCNKDITVPQKSTTTTTDPPKSEASMVAVVEGDSFIAVSGSAVISDTAIIVSGLDNKGGRISLVVKGTDGLIDAVGVFSLVAGEKSYATYKQNASETYRADSATGGGQIRITSVDTVNKLIYGAFSFQGERASNGATKTITGGSFKMTYVLDIEPEIDENDTVYSTNPKRSLSKMSAIVDSDTIDFNTAESFMYLGYLHLTGYNNDGERIIIEISPDAGVGAVQLSGNFGPNSAYYTSPKPNSLDYAAVAGMGNLSITANDLAQKHVVGTFSFQGKLTGASTTKQINNGKIDFYY